MNFQANSLTAGATYGSLDAAKAGKVNVSDSERLFEGCFEDSWLDSARADQGFEWEAGAGEKPLKLADEGLGGGDEDGQVADSVAGEEGVGIDHAMQQGMYSSASPIDPLTLRQFVSAGGDSLTVEESAKVLLLTGSSAKSAAPLASGHGPVPAMASGSAAASQGLEGESQKSDSTQSSLVQPNQQSKLGAAVASPRRSGVSEELASERAPVVSADAIKLSKTAARMVQPVLLANSSFSSASASSVLTTTQTAVSISGGSSKGGEGESQKGDPNSSSLLQTTQQVKVDAAAMQKAENVRVFIHRVESAAHALRQETSNVIQLRVSLAGGEVIKLRLSLRGTKLKTLIQADHEQTRSMLRASWSEVSRALAGKGIDAPNLEFEQSAGDGATKDQAFTGDDRNLPGRVSTGGFARSDSDTREADLSTAVNERVQQLQFFSRIA